MGFEVKVSGRCGFTLIEMLVVISMIAILTSIALPSFQDRIIRSQVEESIELGKFVKSAVDEYYIHTGVFPGNNLSAGLPEKNKIMGNYVEQIEVINGSINITLGKKANKHIVGKVLTIRPAIVRGESAVPIAWTCGKSAPPEGMDIVGTDATNLDNIHLPLDCRQLFSSEESFN